MSLLSWLDEKPYPYPPPPSSPLEDYTVRGQRPVRNITHQQASISDQSQLYQEENLLMKLFL